MTLMRQNMNVLWASVLVEELCRNGVDRFFVSPGNRNAPLVAALVHHPHAIAHSCMDERGAAYCALGFAKATGRPGVVVCTSGTALANYGPAVIEAFRDHLPLVVLSADRPPELTGSDANQTISQEGLFGPYCLENLNLPCPDPDFPLTALAARICRLAQTKTGPVHINCRFREPLMPVPAPSGPVPTTVMAAAERYFAETDPATLYPQTEPYCPNLSGVITILNTAKSGLLVVGRLETEADRKAARSLALGTGWPVYCDFASSLKGTAGEMEIFLPDHPKCRSLVRKYAPDVILQLGSGLISKHYYNEILKTGTENIIQVSPRREHRDPAFAVTIRITASVAEFCRHLGDGDIRFKTLNQKAAKTLVRSIQDLALDLHHITPDDVLSFPLIADIINRHVPAGDALFAGNSTAVRAFDGAFGCPGQKVRIVTNRGASGIEGNFATSIGFSAGSGRRVTAVIGDVSMLHDLNSLALPGTVPGQVIGVVVNNQGGRIFDRLPVQEFPDIATPMMTTPHGFNFSHAARMFSLPYVKAETPEAFEAAYVNALSQGGCRIIEVMLDPATDLKIFLDRQKL